MHLQIKSKFIIFFITSFFTIIYGYTQPINDNCEDAILFSLEETTYSFSGSFSGSNSSLGLPASTCGLGYDSDLGDVWFKFETGSVVDYQGNFGFIGHGEETTIQLYISSDGNCGSSLIEVACDKRTSGADGEDGALSSVSLLPNSTYYIRGAMGSYFTFPYTFQANRNTSPTSSVNDECENAIEVYEGIHLYTNNNESTNSGFGCSNGDDVWFKFTSPSTLHNLNLTLNSGGYWGGGLDAYGYTRLALYKSNALGSCSSDMELLACGEAWYDLDMPYVINSLPLESNKTYYLLISTEINEHDFGFVFDFEAPPLSIDIINFNVEEEIMSNNIMWKLSSINTENYSLEVQKSLDGISFSTIHFEQNIQLFEQMFKDEELVEKTFYRLKVIEASGKISYSNVEYIDRNLKKVQPIIVSPNPANYIITIKQVNKSKGVAEIRVYDIFGKEINKQILNKEIILDISHYPNGTYVIKYSNSEQTYSTKFNKIN